MNILEGNKLIAQFLGYEYIEDGMQLWRLSDKSLLQLPKTEYHSSWDWLMPVVEKIEGIKYSEKFVVVEIALHQTKIYCKGTSDIHIFSITDYKAISTWLAVVEFIKWYNTQNQ